MGKGGLDSVCIFTGYCCVCRTNIIVLLWQLLTNCSTPVNYRYCGQREIWVFAVMRKIQMFWSVQTSVVCLSSLRTWVFLGLSFCPEAFGWEGAQLPHSVAVYRIGHSISQCSSTIVPLLLQRVCCYGSERTRRKKCDMAWHCNYIIFPHW